MFGTKHCSLLVLCITTFCLFRTCSSSGVQEVRFEQSNSHDFDVLIFTQRWPITFCAEWMESNPDHVCVLPSQKDVWTIHGIWPTRFGSIGPSFCNKTAKFNVHELDPFISQLEQFWLNIEKGHPVESLWSHEWLKHGTCAAVLPELGNENKYFGQGLSWLQQYTMSSLLAKANILPDNEYNVADIFGAVKNALNKNPSINCIRDKKTRATYLSEIRICFNKQLELCDCDGVVETLSNEIITNCETDKPIGYPSKLPPALLERVNGERERERYSFNWRHPFVNFFKLVNLLKLL